MNNYTTKNYNGEMKLFTGWEYMLLDVANQFGIDDRTYEYRLDWARENLSNLEAFIDEAEEPEMFFKALLAIRDTQNRLPTGHLVGFDAAASGIQLLSVTTRCEIGMRNSGAISQDTRPDIYTTCKDQMHRVDYVRKVVKAALMTYYYGSEKEPAKAFGEGSYDLELFFKAAEAVAPGAYAIRSILQSAWQSHALSHDWDLPDHGQVHKRVWVSKQYRIQEPLLDNRSFTFQCDINEGKERGVSLIADVTHSIDGYLLRELNRRCNYNVWQLEKVKTLILNQIEFNEIAELDIDRTKCRSLVETSLINEDNISDYTNNQLNYLLHQVSMSLRHESFQVVNVHDEFKCSPKHMSHLRKHYNEILFELYHSDIICDIYHQLTGDELELDPIDHAVAALVRSNSYAVN